MEHKPNCLRSTGVSCGPCPERKMGCLVCHPVPCTCYENFKPQPMEENLQKEECKRCNNGCIYPAVSIDSKCPCDCHIPKEQPQEECRCKNCIKLGCENCGTHIGKFIGLPKEEPKRECKCGLYLNWHAGEMSEGKCELHPNGELNQYPKNIKRSPEVEQPSAWFNKEIMEKAADKSNEDMRKLVTPKEEPWEERFKMYFEDVQIHSKGLGCFQDAIRVFHIKKFISNLLQEQKKALLEEQESELVNDWPPHIGER